MKDYKQMNAQALSIAEQNGKVDGIMHKTWVIDQMVRALTGGDYEEFVALNKDWEQGFPP